MIDRVRDSRLGGHGFCLPVNVSDCRLDQIILAQDIRALNVKPAPLFRSSVSLLILRSDVSSCV